MEADNPIKADHEAIVVIPLSEAADRSIVAHHGSLVIVVKDGEEPYVAAQIAAFMAGRLKLKEHEASQQRMR